MALGRSVRIYLAGGEVSGIRHAELVNWTGQALLCPRTRIAELVEWTRVVKRPGVYFLLGADKLASPEVYIGESEDVLERLKQHFPKDFWVEALAFASKDENLTKSHVKFLESRLVEKARKASRYTVHNGNQPTLSELPLADRDAMEEFLLNMPFLLGALGHRVLDSVAAASVPDESGEDVSLFYSVKGAKARGAVVDEGFVVFKGSTALKGMAESVASGWTAFKNELVDTGRLADCGSVLEFNDDVLFSSPSAAAAVVYGNNANGRALWKNKKGATLREIEEAKAGGELEAVLQAG